ncbi:hypothetical protein diail_1321 [Diaporthe ilicicola]|nr:hypothetical protein diail_1321 [Diaporthe ilicicola]
MPGSYGAEFHLQHHEQKLVIPAEDPRDTVQTRPLFWAQQQQAITPACVVHARSADDVAAVVRTTRSTGCPFAVRSGGHSDVAGASNCAGCVTVSLAGLDSVDVVGDGDGDGSKVARVGAGATWGRVYGRLEPLGMAVAGGRLTSVGVGGLLLGGGLSHFAGARGWACDGVRGVELVAANGSVVPHVSASSHPDLFRAIRGGGGNFGVITRFDLDAFPQGPMWGGMHVWPLRVGAAPSESGARVTAALVAAFVRFAVDDAPLHPHLSLFAGLGYSPAIPGGFVWAAGQYDTQPRNGGGEAEEEGDEPPVFAAFNAQVERDGGVPKMASTARTSPLSDLAQELDHSEPPGMRSRFTTATFRADEDLLRHMADIFIAETEKALESAGLRDDANFKPMLGIQPLTKNTLQASMERGGNVLGLDVEDGPLVVCSFGWEWSSESDDAIVTAGIKAVLDQSVGAARDRGLYHPFKYMNYAAEDQDPLGSYGPQNVEFMRRVKTTYDPDGLFTTLVPGGFKIA